MDDVQGDGSREVSKPLSASWLRFGGLTLLIGGTVFSTQLLAFGAHWGFAAAVAGLGLAGLIAMCVGVRREALAGRSRLTTPERARLRFEQLHVVWVLGFVISFVAAEPLLNQVSGPIVRGAVVAAPIVLLVVMVAEFTRMIVLSDELERQNHVTALGIAGSGVVAGVTGLSVLATLINGWSEPQGWTLLPVFSVVYGVSHWLLQRRAM
jgi:hypothetical protein